MCHVVTLSMAAKARRWRNDKFKAFRQKAKTTRERLRRRVQPSASCLARFILRSILLLSICALAPILLIFALFHDWLMRKFINYAYIYNVSWEDPRMDRKVLNLQKDDHVITIASAGCNVLDYIIEGARVTAVDFNACQIALTELKATAIRELQHDQVWSIFAQNNIKLLRQLYVAVLRPKLSAPSREFWDEYVNKINSFLYSGTSGFLAYLAFRIVFPLLHLGWIRRAMQRGVRRPEFLQLCKQHEKQIAICCWVLDTMLPYLALFAGVPRRQMALGKGRENFTVIVKHVLSNTDLVYDNYFYLGYLLGEYTPECCPRYLEREHFETLKRNLRAGKLHLFHGSIEQAVKANDSTNGELYTVASLLDHMDWMDKSMISSELSLLTQRMDRKRGRIYWRSFSETVHIPPLIWLNAEKVDDIHENRMGDRVGMYFSTWLAHLASSEFVIVSHCRSWSKACYRSGLCSQIIDGAKIITAPIWKKLLVAGGGNDNKHLSQHKREMEVFYKYQKEGYDSFRENFLHARYELMQCMPVKAKRNMIWIDVGGGTARNLEYTPRDILRRYFKAIYIVDVSASLLSMASRRIEAAGLSDIVHVIEQDFTSPLIFRDIPQLEHKIDMITFSYSLSMIPDKVGALHNAIRFLQPNGHGVLGIADFFLCRSEFRDQNLPYLLSVLRKVEAVFHRKWFEQDGVHLLPTSLLHKVERLTHCVWDERFRGAVPLMPILRPYHGVYVGLTGALSTMQQ